MRLGFWCENCERFYEPADAIAKAALEGDAARCPRCLSLDWPRKNLTVRAKRKDATRPGKYTDARTSKRDARPQRQTRTSQRLEGFYYQTTDQADTTEIERRARQPSIQQQWENAPYVPAGHFDFKSRFTAGGSFQVASLPVKPYGDGSNTKETKKKTVPWTRITQSPGRGKGKDVFGKSADDYAREHLTDKDWARLGRDMKFEWCHMVADSLGGATTKANMFCATRHANTAMLCIESLLSGKMHLEVHVEVDLRGDSELAECIFYSIRYRPDPPYFVATIDGLATGCTEEDGVNLMRAVSEWLHQHKL